MTEAWFGLVGVALGGLLTGAVAVITERARQRRVARIAARVVREHLLDVMRAAEDQAEGQPSDLRGAVDRLVTVWADDRRALAGVLDYETYADVAAGVRTARQVTDDGSDPVAVVAQRAGAAAHALKPLAGAAPQR